MRHRCLGCGTMIRSGSRCKPCLARQKAGYHTPEYQGMRHRIFLRDAHQCQIQSKGCTHTATTMDHINGDKADNRAENLQAACLACNSGKRDR